ncbi:hypothetical protein NDK43_26175 [Neobacillus pocheonensis]|uniref:Uncharacterized protein n=1 Tax=Neobacillus pocheonensis TaxID=363869 RepID=A0ABT0WFV7_9BACI|nr:hypothetical protein [Neobacillus pocheonensis]
MLDFNYIYIFHYYLGSIKPFKKIGGENDSGIKKITHETIMRALDWSYETAVNGGIPGIDSAIELAENSMKKKGTVEQQVNKLIRWQNTKSATSGFLTGLGGD